MRILIAVAAAASLCWMPQPSAANEEMVCASAPQHQWASPEAASARLGELVDKDFVLGIDKGCYEAEVILNDITMIDIYVDPVTLHIVKIRTEGESDS